MLARWAPQLQNLRIVLASQSPRRQELLRNNLGVNFEVILSGFAEDIEKVSKPNRVLPFPGRRCGCSDHQKT
jgi:hypothetical protein